MFEWVIQESCRTVSQATPEFVKRYLKAGAIGEGPALMPYIQRHCKSSLSIPSITLSLVSGESTRQIPHKVAFRSIRFAHIAGTKQQNQIHESLPTPAFAFGVAFFCQAELCVAAADV